MKSLKKIMSVLVLSVASMNAAWSADVIVAGKPYEWKQIGELFGAYEVCSEKLALGTLDNMYLKDYDNFNKTYGVLLGALANVGDINPMVEPSPLTGKQIADIWVAGFNEMMNKANAETNQKKLVGLCIPQMKTLNTLYEDLRAFRWDSRWGVNEKDLGLLINHTKLYIDWPIARACMIDQEGPKVRDIDKEDVIDKINSEGRSQINSERLFSKGKPGIHYAHIVDYPNRYRLMKKFNTPASTPEETAKYKEIICKNAIKNLTISLENEGFKSGAKAFIRWYSDKFFGN